jgi:prepilin-type N-terminal cleavage/methylation domain-containing protein
MSNEDGFTLLEAIVAIAVLSAGICSLAQLAAVASETNQRAQDLTQASFMARDKLAQLSALAWTVDGAGNALSDVDSNTAVQPEESSGGTGLAPGGDVGANVPGYCDFLDADRNLMPIGGGPPSGATFTRRWSIEPLVQDPLNTLVIQVSVVGGPPPGAELARLTTVRTRRRPW